MNNYDSEILWHCEAVSSEGAGKVPLGELVWRMGRGQAVEVTPVKNAFLHLLQGFNLQVNGTSPSGSKEGSPVVDRRICYAVSNLVLAIHDSAIQLQRAGQDAEAKRLAMYGWEIQVAWNLVLAGDSDDILKSLEEEKQSRS